MHCKKDSQDAVLLDQLVHGGHQFIVGFGRELPFNPNAQHVSGGRQFQFVFYLIRFVFLFSGRLGGMAAGNQILADAEMLQRSLRLRPQSLSAGTSTSPILSVSFQISTMVTLCSVVFIACFD
tara:strand:+ start:85 stop:453 length:369 start_codon:yes stop_codon:yes gene_type:complete